MCRSLLAEQHDGAALPAAELPPPPLVRHRVRRRRCCPVHRPEPVPPARGCSRRRRPARRPPRASCRFSTRAERRARPCTEGTTAPWGRCKRTAAAPGGNSWRGDGEREQECRGGALWEFTGQQPFLSAHGACYLPGVLTAPATSDRCSLCGSGAHTAADAARCRLRTQSGTLHTPRRLPPDPPSPRDEGRHRCPRP